MPIKRYRITEPTIAISQDGGRGVAHTVSAGSIVELQNGPMDADKLIEVIWNGRTVMMFTQDLRQRSVAINDV